MLDENISFYCVQLLTFPSQCVWISWWYALYNNSLILLLFYFFTPVGKSKDLEKAKDKYKKAVLKLHKTHNEYVLSLKAATLHQEHYRTSILPRLLECLQQSQESQIAQMWVTLIQYKLFWFYKKYVLKRMPLMSFLCWHWLCHTHLLIIPPESKRCQIYPTYPVPVWETLSPVRTQSWGVLPMSGLT